MKPRDQVHEARLLVITGFLLAAFSIFCACKARGAERLFSPAPASVATEIGFPYPVIRLAGLTSLKIGADTYSATGYEFVQVQLPPPAFDAGPRKRSICIRTGGPTRHPEPFDIPEGAARCYPETSEWVSEVNGAAAYHAVIPFQRTSTKLTEQGRVADMLVEVWWSYTGTMQSQSDGKPVTVWIGDPIGSPANIFRLLLPTTSSAKLPVYVVPQDDERRRAIRSLAAAGPREVVCVPGPKCVPPATYLSILGPPFDAPVRFGSLISTNGQQQWLWIRNGNPSRSCTPEQIADKGSDGYGCQVPLGAPLFRTLAFTVTP